MTHTDTTLTSSLINFPCTRTEQNVFTIYVNRWQKIGFNFSLDTIYWDTYWRNKGPDFLESTILKMKGKLSIQSSIAC